MSISDIYRSISPYVRESQGQLWSIAIVVLVIVIAITTVYALYDSLTQLSFGRKADQQLSPVINATSESTITQVIQAPLFGASEPSATAHINTSLSLLGIMASTDQAKARAFIASQGSKAKVYKVNDEIVDGGRISSIYADRVVLLRDGRLETLYLDWTKRNEKSLVPKAVPNTNNASDDNSSSENEAVMPTPTAVMPQTTTPQTPEGWQERLKEIREQYQKQYNLPAGAVSAPTPFGPSGKMNFRRGEGL